jgi:hypothetical protein
MWPVLAKTQRVIDLLTVARAKVPRKEVTQPPIWIHTLSSTFIWFLLSHQRTLSYLWVGWTFWRGAARSEVTRTAFEETDDLGHICRPDFGCPAHTHTHTHQPTNNLDTLNQLTRSGEFFVPLVRQNYLLANPE